MSNTTSAEKRIRQTMRRTVRNKACKTALRNAITKFKQRLSSGNLEAIEKDYAEVSSVLDRAASNGMIHKKNASRKKSRFAIMIVKAKKAKA